MNAEGGHLIKRPRLTRMLDESEARIILLVAPAGYGKTTLAREWLEGKPHVWYRASVADADVAALAVGLATAAAEIVPGIDRRIRQRLRAARDPESEAERIADIVAQDLACLRPDTWLALDDYQEVGSSGEIFLKRLVDVVRTRVLITSRVRPMWASARSVVYGGAAALGRSELAMTDEEVALTVGRSRIEAPLLFENAMGWPAVVGLAARVGATQLETHELPEELYNFFAEELWSSLPEGQRWDLAQLALASPMPWNAVENLFGDGAVPLLAAGASGGWITRDRDEALIHPLLQRFLKERFETLPERLRKRAVREVIAVMTMSHEWDQAMSLALDRDRSFVSSVFMKALDRLLEAGRITTIERWLEAAHALHLDDPVFSLGAAEVAFRRGDYARAQALARVGARSAGDPALEARCLLRAGRSALMQDRFEEALELFKQARVLANTTALSREAIFGEVGAALDLGVRGCESLLAELPPEESPTDVVRGASVRLNLALRIGGVEEKVTETTPLLAVLDDVADPLVRTAFLYNRAAALNALGRFRDSIETVASLQEEAATYGVDFAIAQSQAVRAAAEAGLRNFERARQILSSAIAAFERDGDLTLMANAHAIQACIEGSSGSGHIPEVRTDFARVPARGVYTEYLASVAMCEARAGDRSRASSLLKRARDGHLTAEGEVLIAWLAAILDEGSAPLARNAFALTVERGYYSAFVFAYRCAPPLLAALACEHQSHRLQEVLIRANDVELANLFGLHDAARQAGRVRLTNREIDVYRLMVDGLSNRLIAKRLFIAEPTAKLHVRHILAKLSARSRAEAVAKWRDVLPDT